MLEDTPIQRNESVLSKGLSTPEWNKVVCDAELTSPELIDICNGHCAGISWLVLLS